MICQKKNLILKANKIFGKNTFQNNKLSQRETLLLSVISFKGFLDAAIVTQSRRAVFCQSISQREQKICMEIA